MEERLTIRDELGVSLDKKEDCIDICWNCSKPVNTCPHISYALDKLAEYEDIGTLEECKLAVSGQSINEDMKRKLQEYEAIGTAEGYKDAVDQSLEYYLEMRNYKDKLQEQEALTEKYKFDNHIEDFVTRKGVDLIAMYQVSLTTEKGTKVYVSTVEDRYSRFWNYETKVFELTVDENYNEQIGEELYVGRHYQTKEEALAGHKKTCEYVIANL